MSNPGMLQPNALSGFIPGSIQNATPVPGYLPSSYSGGTRDTIGGYGGNFFPGGGAMPLGTDPRSALLGGFNNVLNRAENLFQAGPQQYFPGQLVAPLNQTQLGAVNAAQGALQSPLTGAANMAAYGALNPFSGFNPGATELARTASGAYLTPDSNPYLRAQFRDVIAPEIGGAVNSAFIQGGRFGSPANMKTYTDRLGVAANQLFGTNFENERARQLQAAGAFGNLSLGTQQLVPNLLGGNLRNQLGLFDLGTALQRQQQNQIDAERARFDFNQQSPTNLLAQYANFINAANLGQFQRPDQVRTSTGEDIAAGLLSALQIGGSVFGALPQQTQSHFINQLFS